MGKSKTNLFYINQVSFQRFSFYACAGAKTQKRKTAMQSIMSKCNVFRTDITLAL